VGLTKADVLLAFIGHFLVGDICFLIETSSYIYVASNAHMIHNTMTGGVILIADKLILCRQVSCCS
jgi:hypothetical protein